MRPPTLNAKTTGIMATSAVSSLTADETKLSRAIGASLILRAQWNAVTFSGNSERKGEIHCMKKNPAPSPKNWTAMVLIESTKGVDMITKTKLDTKNSPRIAATRCFLGILTIAKEDASRTSSGSSSSEGSLDKSHM